MNHSGLHRAPGIAQNLGPEMVDGTIYRKPVELGGSPGFPTSRFSAQWLDVPLDEEHAVPWHGDDDTRDIDDFMGDPYS